MSYILTSHWPGTSVILSWGSFFIARVFDCDLDSSHFFSLLRDSSQLAYQLAGYIVDL